MRRFYLPPDVLDGRQLRLTGPDVKHMATVLRLKPGTHVEFFDDQGIVHSAIIDDLSPNRLSATVVHTSLPEPASLFPITLVQSVLKGKKMDLITQKATELGVECLLGVTTRYCERRGEQDRQMQRQQRIIIEACKQSKRTIPMHLLPVVPLQEVDFSRFTQKFLALENERRQSFPMDLSLRPGPICLCIGPEGGWHPDESSWLIGKGFIPVSLGSTILRAETAAIAAVSILSFLTTMTAPNDRP